MLKSPKIGRPANPTNPTNGVYLYKMALLAPKMDFPTHAHPVNGAANGVKINTGAIHKIALIGHGNFGASKKAQAIGANITLYVNLNPVFYRLYYCLNVWNFYLIPH